MMPDSNQKSIFEIRLDEAEEARLNAIADPEIYVRLGVPHEKVRE
jgi:hypothetical protein